MNLSLSEADPTTTAENQRTALVFGGTGLIGQRLVELLVEDNDWGRIIVVSRRPLHYVSTKIDIIIADLDSIENCAADLKADSVFICLGTTIQKAGSRDAFRKVDHDYIVRCAAVAHEQGATRCLLVSSVGANASSKNFYTRIKGETEQDLIAIGYDAVDILRPSLLLGEREEDRPKEDWARRFMPVLEAALIGRLRRWLPIKGDDVAQNMAAIAKHPSTGVVFHESDALTRANSTP